MDEEDDDRRDVQVGTEENEEVGGAVVPVTETTAESGGRETPTGANTHCFDRDYCATRVCRVSCLTVRARAVRA